MMSARVVLFLLIGHRLGWAAMAAAAAEPPPPPAPPPGIRLLDVMPGGDPGAAARAWQAADGTGGTVEAITLGGAPVLRFRCAYSSNTLPRAVWDRAVSLDLSRATAVVLDIYAERLDAVDSMTLYLRSGDGWYGAPWFPKQERAWRRVRIPRRDFTVDKPGGGWAQIHGLRLSPWAARREDATLYIARIGVEESDGRALFVTSDPNSKYAATMQALLDRAGLPLPMLAVRDLTPTALAEARLVILPYEDAPDAAATAQLAAFVRRGGKLIACFTLPAELASLLGVQQEGFRPATNAGEFSSFRFAGLPPAGVQPAIQQASWAVIRSRPVKGTGTVTAWWHDAAGKRTDAPAVIASKNGAWFSHVVLEDDPAAKAAWLLDLVAAALPDLRGQACARRMARIGAEVSDVGWEEAVRQVEALPAFASTGAEAARLAEAQAWAGKARTALAASHWLDAVHAADQADALLRQAYCLAQQPVEPEFRGTWCHPAEGVRGWNWDRTAETLAQAGIRDLFLNAMHGASTAYPSRYAPFDRSNPDKQDYLQEAVTACRKRGIRVHAWITNYQLFNQATDDWAAQLRAEGRLQVDQDGKTQPVLCPLHETNVQLQRDLMVEAAGRPGVAGVHFDYIRYPDERTCFCATCHKRFEERIGKPVAAWPRDALAGGPWRAEWLQFRRDAITRLVREVVQAVRKAAPGCRISAAVFNNYPACRDSVGQDWTLWVREGLLDFVCPMNYTASDAQFRDMAVRQMEEVGGRIPCYPGIGLYCGLGPVGALRQIGITRDLKTGGFMILAVEPETITAVYPYLRPALTTGRAF